MSDVRTRVDTFRREMTPNEYMANSIAFVKLVGIITTVYLLCAMMLGLLLTIMQRLRHRKRCALSDKYTAAFSMIYMVERLHGRRMQETRDRIIRAMWNNDIG